MDTGGSHVLTLLVGLGLMVAAQGYRRHRERGLYDQGAGHNGLMGNGTEFDGKLGEKLGMNK
eukprot:1320302-Amorphochlora_amoeboformis.AAC.2